MNLPIDIVPGSRPPKFTWRQIIETPIGRQTVTHEGEINISAEGAIEALIMIAKQLNTENKLLKAKTPESNSNAAPPSVATTVPAKAGVKR